MIVSGQRLGDGWTDLWTSLFYGTALFVEMPEFWSKKQGREKESILWGHLVAFSYPKSHRGMQCHALHNPPVSSMWISCGLSHTHMQTHTHTHTHTHPSCWNQDCWFQGREWGSSCGQMWVATYFSLWEVTLPLHLHRFHLNLTLDWALCVWVGRMDGGDGQALCQQGKHS